MRRLLTVLLLVPLLASCELPSWIAGPKHAPKRAPGERTDVITGQGNLKPDPAAQDTAIEVPDQAALDRWTGRNDAMLTAHIGLVGIDRHQSATIGDGDGFSRTNAPTPIVQDQLVIAMDAAGVISAHEADDIEKIRWTSRALTQHHVTDLLGGGLSAHENVLFATSGYGRLAAFDLKTGKVLWKTDLGAPVRGAPAVGAGSVLVLTADDQTLAFDEAKGTPRWEHRGIRESAGYVATTSPVISDDGIALVAYSSGEVFALRAETGSVLWTDTVSASDKTHAAAAFSGIDADPIVQDGVAVISSAGGTMQASALLNGRPLWQQRIGTHMTPWSAGNALFLISITHDLAAILKRDGTVRWAVNLSEADDHGKDITPALFGPILSGNAVMVIESDGTLATFRPQDGHHLKDYPIAGDIVAPPVIAGGAMYLVDKSAHLHKYY